MLTWRVRRSDLPWACNPSCLCRVQCHLVRRSNSWPDSRVHITWPLDCLSKRPTHSPRSHCNHRIIYDLPWKEIWYHSGRDWQKKGASELEMNLLLENTIPKIKRYEQLNWMVTSIFVSMSFWQWLHSTKENQESIKEGVICWQLLV